MSSNSRHSITYYYYYFLLSPLSLFSHRERKDLQLFALETSSAFKDSLLHSEREKKREEEDEEEKPATSLFSGGGVRRVSIYLSVLVSGCQGFYSFFLVAVLRWRDA